VKTEKLDPNLDPPLKENELPMYNVEITETVKPNLVPRRNENEDPTPTLDTTEKFAGTFCVNLTPLKTERREPSFSICRSDIDDPNLHVARTDSELPKSQRLNTDRPGSP
jgi:hypothetical protein